MRKSLIFLTGIFFFSFFINSWSQFNFQKTDYSIGTNPEYATTGDFDKDGDLDIAVGKWIDQNLSILFNNGQGDFSSRVTYSDVSGCNNVLAVDIDKDGDLDLIIPHRYNYLAEIDSTLSVFKNDGSGTFSGSTLVKAGSGPIAVTSFDLDSDGDLDLMTANYYGGDMSILINLGDGTFDTPLHIVTGDSPTDIASADLDKDGDLDLAVSNRGSNTVSILFNQGDGTFAPKIDYISNLGPRFVGVYDLDSDGDLDLAVPNFDASTISIFKNQGNGTFEPAVSYPTGEKPSSVAFPDLDKDGDPDLVVANYYSHDFSFLENISNGQFAFRFNQPTGERAVSVVAGDWNQDSWTDLAVTNTFGNNISVFLNIPALYGVRVLAGLDEFGFKGDRTDVEFNLKNIGQVTDSFQVTVTDSLGWTFSPSSLTVQLNSLQEILLTIGVNIPPTALEGSKNKITLTATSLSSPALKHSASLLVTVLSLCGDINNDGKQNLSDIVYYINFLFKSGPSPCNPVQK